MYSTYLYCNIVNFNFLICILYNIISVYNIPVLHNGQLNSITNSTDMVYNNVSTLSLSTADSRYLKLSGGTVTGNIIVNNETVTNLIDTNDTDTSETVVTSLTVPSITISTNTNTQTIGQIGYYISNVKALSGASISNGSISTAGFCNVVLLGGVYMVQIYAYITGTTQIDLTKYQYGLCTSSTALNGTNMIASYCLESVPNGATKYFPPQTYIVRISTSTTLYNQILLGWSTTNYSPTITINYGFNVVRIA